MRRFRAEEVVELVIGGCPSDESDSEVEEDPTFVLPTPDSDEESSEESSEPSSAPSVQQPSTSAIPPTPQRAQRGVYTF